MSQLYLLSENYLHRLAGSRFESFRLVDNAISLAVHPVLPLFYVACRESYKAFYLASERVKFTEETYSMPGISTLRVSPFGDKLAVASNTGVLIQKVYSYTEKHSINFLLRTIRLTWVDNDSFLTLSEIGSIYLTNATTLQRTR